MNFDDLKISIVKFNNDKNKSDFQKLTTMLKIFPKVESLRSLFYYSSVFISKLIKEMI